jgi:hypothetical protein
MFSTVYKYNLFKKIATTGPVSRARMEIAY